MGNILEPEKERDETTALIGLYVKAVSYTHLDVYKRQDSIQWLRVTFMNFTLYSFKTTVIISKTKCFIHNKKLCIKKYLPVKHLFHSVISLTITNAIT